jgi:hypothetical protein
MSTNTVSKYMHACMHVHAYLSVRLCMTFLWQTVMNSTVECNIISPHNPLNPCQPVAHST